MLACFGKSRIGVWTVVQYRNFGESDSEFLYAFPYLKHSELDAAWQYYAENQDVIDAEIELQSTDDFESTPVFRNRAQELLELVGYEGQ
jgi:uncharacterized protein (DUF433 family)